MHNNLEEIIYQSGDYRIKSDTFDTNTIANYRLVLRLSHNDLIVGVLDLENKACLTIEKHSYKDTNTPITITLQNIWNHHEYLKAGFWKDIVVIMDNLQFTYLPASLYNNKLGESCLILNTSIDTDHSSVQSHLVDSYDVVCSFALQSELKEWIKSQYPADKEIKYVHNTSAFLEGVASYESHTQEKAFFASIYDNSLNIIAISEDKLLFVNSFSCQNSNDILYYLLVAIEECGQVLKEASLTIFGNFEIESSLMDKLKNYIGNILIGQRPEGIKTGFQFDELPDYMNYEIYSALKF